MRPVVVAALLLVPLFALPAAEALPTPGLFCDASEAAVGRVFPEAQETNDFVSYDEARCGLKLLEEKAPDRVRLDVVGKSVGWDSITGGRDQFDVFVVRVTNEKSALPSEQKMRILFQLSIHGNEKGGREGGLRVIEDLARGIGLAKAHPELVTDLDAMELLFVFPNPDGWTHEEAEYRAQDACYASLVKPCKVGQPGAETQNFVRVNGNGKDVNRQWPTVGWQRASHKAMAEPEALALVTYLKGETNIAYASDIHGMLQPADGSGAGSCAVSLLYSRDPSAMDPTCFQNAAPGAKGHYVLTMLPAGRQDPREMHLSTTLAERIKERLNADPYFVEWHTAPAVDDAWGGEFNDWGTVWDTIGYSDSGFTSDFYAQDSGLDAPGVDFELSYNHMSFDNYYPGAAQRMNAYHVEIVREIVRAFMDQARLDVAASIDAKGTRTAFLESPTLVTNEGDLRVDGWPRENAADDAFDAAHRVFRATPNDYFVDLRAHLRDGDAPGVLDAIPQGRVTSDALASYSNLVIAGSAGDALARDPAALAAVKSWVEAGGNLVLTDSALRLLEPLGLAPANSVNVLRGYAGATNFVDKEHELARGVRGLARQTYEPVALGFTLETMTSPNWYVKADAIGGDVVGVAGAGQGSRPNASMANFGRAPLGDGRVTFLGALLPDPTLAYGAPYGVDSYATTYTGNQLLRNALGWEVVATETPLTPAQLAAGDFMSGTTSAATTGNAVPGIAVWALFAGLAIAVALRRRVA